jgi:ATP-dependent DNA helicase RecG
MWEAAGSQMWEASKRSVRKADLPFGLRQALRRLGKRSSAEAIMEVIRDLCRFQPMTKAQLAALLQRSPRHVAERYLAAMVASGELVLRFPEQPAHPEQAYGAPIQPKKDGA